jgi:CspA family cold shock protein
MKRVKGVVKWFDARKGYGFIRRDDGPDVFVHFAAILENGYRILHEGEVVEFEVVGKENAPEATRVVQCKE